MTRTFFDLSLQAFLERRFQIRAEIVEKPPETAVPAIATVHGYSYGSIYGDAGDAFLVQLYNGPFALRLEFAVHHESAQIATPPFSLRHLSFLGWEGRGRDTASHSRARPMRPTWRRVLLLCQAGWRRGCFVPCGLWLGRKVPMGCCGRRGRV